MSKIVEFIIELVGWIQIMLSLTLIGFGLGIIVYIYMPNTLGLSIGIFLTLLGLALGIIITTRSWKKKGTMHLMSRVSSTPELDNLHEPKTKSENNLK